MKGFEAENFIPIGESARFDCFDVDRKSDLPFRGKGRRDGAFIPPEVRFYLFRLLVEETREEKKAVVDPLKPGFALGNSPFSQDHGLFPARERVGNKLPFFESNGAPVGVGWVHEKVT